MYNKKQIDDFISVSSKIEVMFQLLCNLKAEGHRVLIFSLSKKMLDLLEYIINNHKKYCKLFKYIRIDGDTEIASRD